MSIPSIREPAAIAFETLRTHKLRSFLMLLGIILSVSTLILVVALIHGTNDYIASRVANMGSEVFIVSRFGIINSQEEYIKALRRNKRILWEDYAALRDDMRIPRNVGAAAYTSADVKHGAQLAEDVTIHGVTANIGEMGNAEVAQGRYVSETDNDHRSEVCILGNDVVTKLFPGVDPIGKTINVKGHEYTVVGIGKTIGNVMGQSQDNFITIPVQSWLKDFGDADTSLDIQVQATPGTMEQAKDEARLLLRARHHLDPNAADNFGIFSSDTLMNLFHSLTGTLAGAMVVFVSLFLVIGGVVVMNVMLASVTERTREIGIRKSLGARTSDILCQFLVESATMTAMGGVFGVAFAWVVALILDATTPMPMKVPLTAVIVALVVSTAIGIFFGVYPARKASRLDPIEALRFEA
jgi:putative ABC transport system permease protein